jgi:hypothetical protein
LVQSVLYIIYLGFFQVLIASVRAKDEVYLTKYLIDNILEEPINTEDGLDNDFFNTIANVGDIDLFVNEVLLPALVQDEHMDESKKTPAELAQFMDNFDWSSGLLFKQTRVLPADPHYCGIKEVSAETSGMMRWFAEQRYGECTMDWPLQHLIDAEAPDAPPGCAIAQVRRLGPCYPEISTIDIGPDLEPFVSKQPFGFNWTHPDMPPAIPWKYFTVEELGANPGGQPSASTSSSYNTLPTDGFIAVIIPFFSAVLLPDQEGKANSGDVLDFRDFQYNVSRGVAAPNYFCVRLSFNGVDLKQLCDPNDEDGLTTGRVPEMMHTMWANMKAGHWVDSQTRVLSFTLPVRSNHANVKSKLTMMLQLTSLGGVLPSFEFDSRLDIINYRFTFTVLYLNMALVMFFVIVELLEVYEDGTNGTPPTEYFSNMWNLMDWSGFLLFTLLFVEFHYLRDALLDTSCSDGAYLCTQVGFYDDWQTFSHTSAAKTFLSMASTLQLLKLLKFINVLVPKMALATSVLSHGLADLVMFTVFFSYSIFAFAQMFFIQLGPYLDNYNDLTSSFIELFRALFGDFDITLIMDNSSNYLNAILLILYLFAAIFVLLSIFLTILGEHQGFVRDIQQEEIDKGSHVPEFGLFAYLGSAAQEASLFAISKLGKQDEKKAEKSIKYRKAAVEQWRHALDMLIGGGYGAAAPAAASEDDGGGGDGGGAPPVEATVVTLEAGGTITSKPAAAADADEVGSLYGGSERGDGVPHSVWAKGRGSHGVNRRLDTLFTEMQSFKDLVGERLALLEALQLSQKLSMDMLIAENDQMKMRRNGSFSKNGGHRGSTSSRRGSSHTGARRSPSPRPERDRESFYRETHGA